MHDYQDRKEAGQILANELKAYTNRQDVVVLALPRGGVPVAYEVAKALKVPLDVFIVRKLGVPDHEELAMGAIAENAIFLNDDIIRQLDISQTEINKVIDSEKEEMHRREIVYRGNKIFPDLTHKTVILIDDGIATGATMRVAVKAIRQKNPDAIIIAVPVAEVTTCKQMEKIVDKLVCPLQPSEFHAVGLWYENFQQTTDEEVRNLLMTPGSSTKLA